MLTLRYDDIAIGIAAGPPGHCEWLAEFLCPPFAVGPEAAAGVRIELVVDPQRFRACASGFAPGGEIDCFAFDSSVLRLPVQREPGGALLVFDQQFGLYYRVGADAPRIEVIAHRDRPVIRTPLMRLVREVAMNHARRRGQLFLHAAGIVREGRGAILCGVKNAGKTTLVLHAMLALGADCLANDRVVVTFGEGALRLRGMPSIVTVRAPTLTLLPAFGERLLASGYHSRATMAEVARGRPRAPETFSDGRYGLTPIQMTRLAGVERVAEASAHSIAFPTLTRRPGGIAVRPLERAAAATRLAAIAWEGSNLNQLAPAFDFATAPSRGPVAWPALGDRLLAGVRCYEVELGTEAYADAGVSRAELGKLFA